MPAPDSLKDGRYVITSVLGEGSQGSTFEAVDKREGRLVAIKKFEVKTAKRWKDVELAERETRVLASLSHPDLPKYLEHFEEDGALYLVMERVAGSSLAAYRKSGGTFRTDDVERLLEQASLVLDYLHGRAPPIIHRDLKPGNVIRRPDGSFAFVDFGAVRDRLRPEGGSTVVGTFGYMAPEQFQGRAVPASDVYSIGATALWMLTGEQPEDLPHRGLAIDVEAALGGRARPELVAVLRAMLDPDPDARATRIAPLLVELAAQPASPRAAGPPPAPSEAPDASDMDRSPGGYDFPAPLLRFLRRALPLLWVASALAWWWLSFRSAMSFTFALVVLSYVTRGYAPRKARRRVKARVAAEDASARVRIAEGEKRADEEDADEEVEAPRRAKRR